MKHTNTDLITAFFVGGILLLAGLMAGCQTVGQRAATAAYAAGAAVGNDALRNNPNILPQLQDVAAKLPHLSDGTLNANAMGTLQGEIQNVAAQTTLLKNLFPADGASLTTAQKLLDDAGAAASAALAQLNANNGGAAPTIDVQIAMTQILTSPAGSLTGSATRSGQEHGADRGSGQPVNERALRQICPRLPRGRDILRRDERIGDNRSLRKIDRRPKGRIYRIRLGHPLGECDRHCRNQPDRVPHPTSQS